MTLFKNVELIVVLFSRYFHFLRFFPQFLTSRSENINTYSFSSVLDVQFLRCDKIEQFRVLFFFYAAKCVNSAGLQLNFKVERSSAASASGKVDGRNLLKTDVKWRLVHIHKTPFQRIQKSCSGFK